MSDREGLETLLEAVPSALFYFSDEYHVGEDYGRGSISDLYLRVEDFRAKLKLRRAETKVPDYEDSYWEAIRIREELNEGKTMIPYKNRYEVVSALLKRIEDAAWRKAQK